MVKRMFHCKPHLKLMNITQEPQTFQLERTAWSDQATTAVDVTILQVFRDLFASEVLSTREEISVGSVTLMFTDFRELDAFISSDRRRACFRPRA